MQHQDLDTETHVLWTEKRQNILEYDASGIRATTKLFPHNLIKGLQKVVKALEQGLIILELLEEVLVA